MPGYMNPVVGQGRGMGLGRGWRNRFFATGVPGWSRFGAFNQQPFNDDPEWEKRALKNQLKALESELERVKKRLAEFQEESTGQA